MSDDKSWIACDNNPASPHFGNVYVAWGAVSPLRFARSTDHGAHWKGIGSQALSAMPQAKAAARISHSALCQSQQNVGIPSAVQPERLIRYQIAGPDIEPRRMDAEQYPRKITLDPRPVVGAHHHGGSAGAPVCARIREKVTLPLKTETEGRCDHSVARDRHVM